MLRVYKEEKLFKSENINNRSIHIPHIFGIIAIKCVTEMYQNIPQQMLNFLDNFLLHEELYPFTEKSAFYSIIETILPCIRRFFPRPVICK